MAGTSAIRSVFGIHSVTPYSKSTGLPYGIIKVLKGASLKLSGELVELVGGSFNYPWAVEDGRISAELTFTPKQFEEFMFSVFFGKVPTAASADATGTVTTLTNKYGSSVVSATTGIASVAVKSGNELKCGKYVVKAVNASQVAVYGMSDMDFGRGTDVSDFQDDELKVNASAITIATGGSAYISELGVELVGGSGTIALASGETAMFEILPKSTKSYSVVLGGMRDVTPEFGAYLAAEPRADGEMTIIDCFRCRAIGMPLNLEEKAWGEAEISAKVYYDSVEGGVCRVRSLTPTTPV